MPFKSLGAVCYLPSIVTVAVSVAVCEIFSVKEWRNLENQVRGRTRSLKMAPFHRPYVTFYWSPMVSYCKYSSILYHDLEIWVRGHSRSLKLVPFKSLGTVSYSPSIVTINAKNFHGSLTTVVKAQNDTPKTANINCTIFDRTLV